MSEKQPSKPPFKPFMRFNLLYIFMAIIAVALLRDAWTNYNETTPIPYSEYQQLLDSGEVKEVVLSDQYIRGVLKKPLPGGRNQFVTARVQKDTAKELMAHGVTFTQAVESTFFRDILSWVLPVAIFFGLWMLIMRRMSKSGGLGGSLMSVGKSKAKVYVETDTKVKFDDVAGVDEAKDELVEIVNFLKDPGKFSRLGARMPKGVLLVGPPGTGKTLLAKAVAGEAGVPFFSINGSEFVEMFVGVGAARVRDLFEQARQKAPAIIFVDELDALGKARGSYAGGHDEKEQTLNQMLVEMDGFDTSTGLIVMGATNRPEILDPALLRAGRFDRQVLVDRPDKRGRLAILKVHARQIVLAPDVDLEKVAALTPGFTGADLANLVNEAALIATRRASDMVSLPDFTNGIERIVAGLEKRNRLLNETERRIVAFHEMGHALVAAALPGTDKVHKVSIIPRGIGSLGYTIQRPTEDRYLMTQAELENKMTVLMGGRAAEMQTFGQISTGASDDIGKATNIAREMVTRYGMDDQLGHVAYETEPVGFLGNGGSVGKTRLFSEESAQRIDEAVREYVDGSLDRANWILHENTELLREAALELLQKETLEELDLVHYFERIRKPTEGNPLVHTKDRFGGDLDTYDQDITHNEYEAARATRDAQQPH